MTVSELDVLVLAAGESQRLRGLLQGRPKPLIEVDGESVLRRNLRWLANFGVRRVWINLHYKPEAIQEHIAGGSSLNLSVNYSFERELLGTAGAARALAGLWNRYLLLVYGDSLLHFDLSAMLAGMDSQLRARVAVFSPGRNPHTGVAGSVLRAAPDNSLLSFIETRNGVASVDDWVAAGVHLIPADWLRALPAEYPSDFGRDVFPRWLQEKRPIDIHPIDGYCLGLDTPATYQQALDLIHHKSLTMS